MSVPDCVSAASGSASAKARSARQIGVTFQQVQKYESGDSRIAPSRLFGLAKLLDVRVSYFFDDMPSHVLAGRPVSLPRRKARLGDADAPFYRDKDAPK